MTLPPLSENSAAAIIARFLKRRGVRRVYALCGGHIMPIWMRIVEEGIPIIDVRDERAAVYMAHAQAELTGELSIALVTAGPGITNAMTGIANAHVAKAPVLILSGTPPRAQENRGALQDLDHCQFVRPLTRYARTVREPALVLQELDEAVSRALGEGGEPGPVYLDFPVDTLRGVAPPAVQLAEHYEPRSLPAAQPEPARAAAAAELLWSAKKPLVITGRGARGAGREVTALLDALGAAYLDTGESRGLVATDHPSVVGAMRGAVMGQADCVLTIGRRLDFQLGYGSPAVFPEASFIRIANTAAELRDNRRGAVELLADPAAALSAILQAARGRKPASDRAWLQGLRAKHEARVEKLARDMAAAPDGPDGYTHPNRVLAAIRDRLPEDAVVVADGGDFLSFARVGVPATRYLDPGSLGCIGVGTPFGISAALAFPGKPVVVLTGDGAFGFNAMEIDTAARHRVPLLIVVANNGAWQIEVRDQQDSYGRVAGTYLQRADYAAMARGFGLHAERVEKTADLDAAVARAFEAVAAGRPALLDVLVTEDAPSSDSLSGLAWVPDLQPLAAWDEAERRWRAGT